MKFTIREMKKSDYDQVLSLWSSAEGVGLSSASSKDVIKNHLVRNPGLSFVALYDERIIGAVLCGSDGSRGYIHHLAVDKKYRKKGIGRSLVKSCTDTLSGNGIKRCHIFIFKENMAGVNFWDRLGWLKRTDLIMMSKDI